MQGSGLARAWLWERAECVVLKDEIYHFRFSMHSSNSSFSITLVRFSSSSFILTHASGHPRNPASDMQSTRNKKQLSTIK